VLSIAKLRVGQEAYQLSGVAQSLDDYYTGAGEASGRWAGIGAERLGLTGDVNADDLRAVLAGIQPGTGGLTPDGETIRTHPRRVPGFDLTFKAPKSVSVLYAVSDDVRVQGAIIDAGEVAVRAALGWLEREAVHVRRGNGNAAYINDLAARDPLAAEMARVRSHSASGVVAAMFRHRTSRAGDPLLHWHTLVANLAEGPDGRWTAIVHPDIYRAARAAGELFQTVLRDELTESLGIVWRAGRTVPEVAGVPQGLLDQFSKRSKEIEDWLAATGTPDTREGRQTAVLATRRAKPEVEHERFDAAWKTEATAFGWGPEEAESLITSLIAAPSPTFTVDEEWVGELARELTEHDSTFTRNDLYQAVARRLPDGGSMRRIEKTVAAVIATPHVIPIGDTGDRWTSAELAATERRFLTTATSTVGTRNRLPADLVTAALGQFPTIGPDQHAAVMALTRSADAISVLVGPAGTGKTFTLDAVRTAFEAGSYRVVGAAPSAKAAHELEHGAHIPSATIHRLLGSWSRGYDLPNPDTVLVVDESAMAGTRELDALTSRAISHGARVILVGDHHQLPEVTAGGGFAALATSSPVTVAELTINRRQSEPWERAALLQLRDGHVAAAVGEYRSHGRVVACADPSAMHIASVTLWASARDLGLDAVLVAGTNATVDALNLAARGYLVATGAVGDHLGTWGGLDLAVGETVVLRVNDYRTVDTDGYRTPLLNGHTATIVGATPGGVLARLHDTDSHVELDHAYLAGGGVDYGYALTHHRAQGGTWDTAIAVGTDGLFREAGYLALSRGRDGNMLVVTQAELDRLDLDLARHDSPIPLLDEEPDDLDTALIRRLNRSRAKTLALTVDPFADIISGIAMSTPLATLEALSRNADSAEQAARSIVGVTPTDARGLMQRAVAVANHVAIGLTVKPADRNNLGLVIALADEAGRVTVEFTSAEGRSAQRSFDWEELTIIEPKHPARRTLSAEASTTLDRIVDGHQEAIDRSNAVLADHNVAPDDPHIYRRAVNVHVDRAAAGLAARQPEWLTDTIDHRPTAPAPAQVWDDAVRSIAEYRSRHDVADERSPLGAPPVAAHLLTEWARLKTEIDGACIWLDTYNPVPAIQPRVRTASEIADRRTELDAIIATAPADQRSTIAALIGGQLTLTDTDELLRNALAQQGDRRRWILEHWPHIVESAEIEGLNVVVAETELPAVDDRLVLELD
jgi:conjugative relaxase-like TrwC/TraI family protein